MGDEVGKGTCKVCTNNGSARFNKHFYGAVDFEDCKVALCDNTCFNDQQCIQENCTVLQEPYTAPMVLSRMNSRPSSFSFCSAIGIDESGCTWRNDWSFARHGVGGMRVIRTGIVAANAWAFNLEGF